MLFEAAGLLAELFEEELSVLADNFLTFPDSWDLAMVILVVVLRPFNLLIAGLHHLAQYGRQQLLSAEATLVLLMRYLQKAVNSRENAVALTAIKSLPLISSGNLTVCHLCFAGCADPAAVFASATALDVLDVLPAYVSDPELGLWQFCKADDLGLLLGTPTEKQRPGVSSLRDWHVYPQWEPQNLERAVPSLGPDGVGLLSKMLKYDDEKARE
ncbi:hypothetical protein Nepgr_017429 [Nepenthes gracilis]|uniref:Uncharacterized protein n=1 Tax=Nepenthes gracilis TaxID=150966 RepID=A0AAD3SPF0_NEPGR|nr:hypothetical protein Nepgr_017429 [Nepenthes gracilis]